MEGRLEVLVRNISALTFANQNARQFYQRSVASLLHLEINLPAFERAAFLLGEVGEGFVIVRE